ncbi:arginyl-tRNA synthetase [Ruminococcaceae bacterium YRB3002]|nr:arginyl-tRNA synthetase [Ruminococcaceae bacterium YRB3002]
MDYKQQIADILSEKTGLDRENILKLVEIPPKQDMGDYAFPCFVLAKTLHKAPPVIASEIAPAIDVTGTPFKVKNVGPYINFFIDRSALASDVVGRIVAEGDDYGSSETGAGKNVIVEYSSPNIAKPFHVGHAFTTILGNSLSRIYRKLGYNVIRMNHLGDYGTQFGKLITAYRLWGDEEALNKDPIGELLRIYVKFHQEEKKDPSLTTSARENFRKLEEGCPEEVELWQKFRDMSLVVFNQLYRRLGVEFDNYNGESFYSDKIPEIVDILNEKGLLVESEGAKVVMLDDEGLPPCIILKSDNTTIYASRDLASALYRYRTYNFDKNIYVVGGTQALHFKQVFAVLKKAGFDFADNCEHVAFGLVKFKGMTFSTREGNIVLLEDLLDEAVSKTREIIVRNAEERGQDMSEEEINDISEKLGIGAVIYTYVKSGRERDIVFTWEDMLDFNGDTAPYLIYTYARTRSILRKASDSGITGIENADLTVLTGDDEYALIRALSELPESIVKAASSNEPFMIARQISEIARAHNRFYNNSNILNCDDEKLKTARLALCDAVCTAIREGLDLLGINVVERM